MNIDKLEKLPDAEGRKVLAEISTPGLEQFRQGVKITLTSVLTQMPMVMRADPEDFVSKLGITEQEIEDDPERVRLICAAALIAVNDEIDRRIPIPKETK